VETLVPQAVVAAGRAQKDVLVTCQLVIWIIQQFRNNQMLKAITTTSHLIRVKTLLLIKKILVRHHLSFINRISIIVNRLFQSFQFSVRWGTAGGLEIWAIVYNKSHRFCCIGSCPGLEPHFTAHQRYCIQAVATVALACQYIVYYCIISATKR
jgi:hypothetical protein